MDGVDMNDNSSIDLDEIDSVTDSIDTLELLKGSSTFNDENDDNEYDENEEKTILNDSTDSHNESETNVKQSSDISSLSSLNIENKLKPLQIENTKLNENEDEDEIDTSDLDHLEPKLREAWIQMRKLDKKLAQVTKKEKQAKKETIALIEKNRADLELLRLTTDHKESKLEAENTAHFLALSYVDLDEDLEKELKSNHPESLTPLFKTQLPDIEETSRQQDSLSQKENTKNSSRKNDKSNNNPKNINENIKNPENNSKSSLNTNKTKISNNSKNADSKEKKNKDFIKRNIQLAQDAGGALAMTEEEKQRLNELLLDMDNFENDKDDRSNLNQIKENDTAYIVEYNPNIIKLADGDGFTPTKEELEKLNRINTVLEKRNYSRSTNSRVSGMTSHSNIQSGVIDTETFNALLTSETKQIKLNDDFDENEFGDKFIREVKLSREQEARLKYVDSQLEKLKANSLVEQSNEQQDSASLSDIRPNSAVSIVSQDQLKQLIDEYYSENSQNILENGNREFRKLEALKEEVDVATFQENGLDDMPQINDNVIKQLLDEAKSEGLYQILDQIESTSVQSTERSYYEEALEILKNKENLSFIDEELNNERIVPKVDTENKTEIENENFKKSIDVENLDESFNNENEIRPSLSKSNFSDLNQYDDRQLKNKLPPLTKKNSENDLDREESRLSSISTSSYNSVVFPKIDSRFLPK